MVAKCSPTCTEPVIPVSLAQLAAHAALLGYVKGLLSMDYFKNEPILKQSLSDLVAQCDAARIKNETRK